MFTIFWVEEVFKVNSYYMLPLPEIQTYVKLRLSTTKAAINVVQFTQLRSVLF